MASKFPLSFPGRQVQKRMFPYRMPTAYITLPCATALACDTSWDIRNCICTSSWWRPSLTCQSLRRQRVSTEVPPCTVAGPQQIEFAVGNLVIPRSNHDTTLTSGLMATILIFVSVAWKFLLSKTLEILCSWFPTDRCKPHRKILIRSGDTAGAAFVPRR